MTRSPLTATWDSALRRAARVAWELGGVLPRSVGALAGAGDWNACSMEIFRVVDGRITEVWNCGYKQGVWA
ncbi:hypothetical protein M2272_003753 [Mycobacterium frederiksbergense]|uniref:Nuclear transport factor 2 family protein n=1 Tax=Mycolicibacterium frederiksbergense TaxID=117567 RepID=A0ABT6L2C3_9MYCO|nr:hypothetical protein [Mycolicibacterium frederiksbergense]